MRFFIQTLRRDLAKRPLLGSLYRTLAKRRLIGSLYRNLAKRPLPVVPHKAVAEVSKIGNL
jgi:hypothetical protein